MTMRIVILLVSVFVGFTPAHQAMAYCSEPTPPTCADDLDMFGTSDQWEFDQCKDEIENFKSEIEEYVDCLKSEIDELIDAYNEQVRKYNCKARREGFCY